MTPGAQSDVKDIDGAPLCLQSQQLLDYLRARSAELGLSAIRERVRAAMLELEKLVEAIPVADIRRRPAEGKWNIAEVVDHIAQTQIRGAEELRHLFQGRRPPGPPVYEALRSGAAAWAAWEELVDGLRSSNRELVDVLELAPGAADERGAKVKTILVANHTLPDGGTAPQIFPVDLDWREYALVQRLHALDHRTQIKKIREALAAQDAPVAKTAT
jgi:DinB superfamily